MKKAFSLIEIMVAVTIIGLLSAGLVISFGSSRLKSRETRRLTDIETIGTAIDSYHALTDSYPSSAGANVQTALNDLVATGIINLIPADPQPAQPGAGNSYCSYYYYGVGNQSGIHPSTTWNGNSLGNREYHVLFGSELNPTGDHLHPLNSNIFLLDPGGTICNNGDRDMGVNWGNRIP